MKYIGTITFHASYNYGSNLQAYALQEYIKKINNNCRYEIINLRTEVQKQLYKNCFEKKDLKSIIKQILCFNYKKDIYKRNELFEEFIQNNLNITKEYNSLDELKKEKFCYDYYIAGSDQLWNLQAYDFDWANYLEFVNDVKKISYAASFGPKSQKWNEEEKERVRKDLLDFKNISVREQGSYNNILELTNIKPEMHVDPTMLLNKDDWKKIISDQKVYSKGKYIFLYNLKNDKSIIKIAKRMSKKLHLPIVISNYGKCEIFSGFKKCLNVGPNEFLNLIENAELILSSSFHGTIFSILLNKPFFAINGAKDFRIHTLLEKMGLENRSIDLDDFEFKSEKIYDINFVIAEEMLNKEREKAKQYLIKALEIEE